MKKILAIILSVAMIATMLAVSVSAADKQVVVGDNGGTTDFNPTTTNGQDINVKVTDITHKYAVDVTFGLSDLTIGSVTWNVDDMKYDVAESTLKKTEQTIEVSNRSDLSVYAYATVADTITDDGITVTADKDSATNRLEVVKATVGSGNTNGTATTESITVTIDSADWNAATAYYVEKIAGSNDKTFVIATVTVTISKD